MRSHIGGPNGGFRPAVESMAVPESRKALLLLREADAGDVQATDRVGRGLNPAVLARVAVLQWRRS